jgi:FkbM family methyltransferase
MQNGFQQYSNFNYDSFIEKYRPFIERSGKSRMRFYDYIIPKLAKKGKPIYIVETGTMWSPLNENMGAFTLIFADLIKNHTGGKLYTIDISEKNINLCKTHTEEFSSVIEYVVSDSVSFLRSLDDECVKKLDLVYLDSYDLDTPKPHKSAQHHLDELTAVYPRLNKECGVAIDDNFLPNTYIVWEWYNPDGSVKSSQRCETDYKTIIGKGMYCNQFLESKGWKRFEDFDIHGASNIFYYEKEYSQFYNEIEKPIKSWRFDNAEKKLLFRLNKNINSTKLVLKERYTGIQCFVLESDELVAEFEYCMDLYKIKSLFDIRFSGFVLDIYQRGQLIFSEELIVREIIPEDAAIVPKVDVKISFIKYTENGLGICFTSNNTHKKQVILKIVDCFTGLVFHSVTTEIIQGCEYFFSHAYNVPNQSFRIYDADYQELLFEKIINTDREYDRNQFSENNRNLISIIPSDLKDNAAAGYCFFEIFIRKTYEFEDVKIRSDDIVFDIGANVGMFSRYAFQRGAKAVHAFEPNTNLKECFENLNKGSNYKLVNKAVSSFPVDLVLQNDLFDSYVKKSDSSDSNSSFVNINDYIKENDIIWIDYLKVDIEGAEYDLFNTIDKDFLRDRVVKIALEYHNNNENQIGGILDILTTSGFTYKFEYVDGKQNSLGMLYAVNTKLYKNTK